VRNKKKILPFVILLVILLPHFISAQSTIPKFSLGIEESNDPSDFVLTMKIVFLLTVLALAPSILIMMTSFTRLVIVFHFLRTALATQTVPSNQILAGLALFLTFFIMRPVFNNINENALQPYIHEEITQTEALERAGKPVKTFMLKQTRDKELGLFIDLSGAEKLTSSEDIPLSIVIPAFIVSEFKTAFQIGFLLYLPMLVIDVVVASILLSMGMMMLPPMMISMPLKILLFVLVDGWYVVIGSLVKGFM